MDNAFVIRKILGCFHSWGCGEREEDSVFIISNSEAVGVVELSVLFWVDDEMVQLCVVFARYGRNVKPRNDGMFRRLGGVDLYQRQ